ncbi:adenine nucleotide alpha hydrolase [Paracoccus albus]|uniref:adenine nucleotide alpha hydrolase n=1 Tax=Paracoccus albus TaxID=3017784 RepID=UPI0022F08FFD|nr:adenine nucleotide alpha hydrolase [Paracoccus albus]WBU61511.1 adenine nucleotide alpha hydrolase [Paracoccus albus]
MEGAAQRLERVLDHQDHLFIAVSGGVDSMTLAHAAQRWRAGGTVTMCHAVSPAVPAAATGLVRRHAEKHGWDLHVIEAGEFSDPDYLRNPVNRCYFCKSNLYDRIRGISSGGMIASGANLDDLGDFRPGLLAAKERDVRHPLIEAECTKADIRAIARSFGLNDISELPAQPCLASRIETGIPVTEADVSFIERSESALRASASEGTLRCRIVSGGVRLELGPENWADQLIRDRLSAQALQLCRAAGRMLIEVAPYRQGSAFLQGD